MVRYLKISPDVDCELSEWSTWTVCTVDCGSGGLQQRFRELVRQPEGSGIQCHHQAEQRFGCNENVPCKDNTSMMMIITIPPHNF